jgi:hypothetical protein
VRQEQIPECEKIDSSIMYVNGCQDKLGEYYAPTCPEVVANEYDESDRSEGRRIE